MWSFYRNLFPKAGTTPKTAKYFDKDVIPPYLRVSRHYEVVSSSRQEGEYLYLLRDKENVDEQYYVKSPLKLPKTFRVRQIASASRSFDFVETGFQTSKFDDKQL